MSSERWQKLSLKTEGEVFVNRGRCSKMVGFLKIHSPVSGPIKRKHQQTKSKQTTKHMDQAAWIGNVIIQTSALVLLLGAPFFWAILRGCCCAAFAALCVDLGGFMC